MPWTVPPGLLAVEPWPLDRKPSGLPCSYVNAVPLEPGWPARQARRSLGQNSRGTRCKATTLNEPVTGTGPADGVPCLQLFQNLWLDKSRNTRCSIFCASLTAEALAPLQEPGMLGMVRFLTGVVRGSKRASSSLLGSPQAVVGSFFMASRCDKSAMLHSKEVSPKRVRPACLTVPAPQDRQANERRRDRKSRQFPMQAAFLLDCLPSPRVRELAI